MAVIETGVEAATPDVEIENVTVFAPAGTVTVAGTTAALFELVSETVIPAAGAMPFSVTLFAVVVFPPTTDVGLSPMLVSDGEFTVMVAVLAMPKVAVTVTGVAAETAFVEIVYVAELAPAGTVTDAGTITAGSELASDTTVST